MVDQNLPWATICHLTPQHSRTLSPLHLQELQTPTEHQLLSQTPTEFLPHPRTHMEPPLLCQITTEPLQPLPAHTGFLVMDPVRDPVSTLTVLEAASPDSVTELQHQHTTLLPWPLPFLLHRLRRDFLPQPTDHLPQLTELHPQITELLSQPTELPHSEDTLLRSMMHPRII
jgi:hypothetical protein